ncbi:MAG: hypothetical protein HY900_22875 [Deltaproteobacteria bacterium]|nr:hypothetical protein [Deltaproteobacteria bacterium]
MPEEHTPDRESGAPTAPGSPATELDERSGGERPPGSFPVVGIGCSAGGLEPLTTFLAELPAGIGAAVVVIQHLHPTDNLLVPILQKHCALPVVTIQDGMPIEPGRVHVTPPGSRVALERGSFHLIPFRGAKEDRLSIDFFLRSLADDRGDLAVCVVLSGAGSDGCLGVRAVRGAGGVTMAQDPVTAKFDSMPRSAIETACVDVIAPPEGLASELLSYLSRWPKHRRADPELAETTLSRRWTREILALLHARTGHDFALYKANTVIRRIQRRMDLQRIEDPAEYLRYLGAEGTEAERLFQDLLIGVTSFFRDADAYDALKATLVAEVLAKRSGAGDPVRVWVPACSTGEEAYSLAMLLEEGMADLGRRISAQVFATDLDPAAIARARLGLYPESISADVPEARLARFFRLEESGAYRVTKEIREVVIFATQDVLQDPPPRKSSSRSTRSSRRSTPSSGASSTSSPT